MLTFCVFKGMIETVGIDSSVVLKLCLIDEDRPDLETVSLMVYVDSIVV